MLFQVILPYCFPGIPGSLPGIILMGIVVTCVNRFLGFLQKKLVKWDYV